MFVTFLESVSFLKEFLRGRDIFEGLKDFLTYFFDVCDIFKGSKAF